MANAINLEDDSDLMFVTKQTSSTLLCLPNTSNTVSKPSSSQILLDKLVLDAVGTSTDKDEVQHSSVQIENASTQHKCSQCSYSTRNEETMKRHLRKHQGQNPFGCETCEYSTYNKTLFEEHVNIHQGVKPFKCAHCPHASVSKKNLKKHEAIHRPDYPLKCTNCDFIARHKRSLLFHKIHDCIMTDKESLLVQETSESEFKCRECGYTAKNAAKYLVHESTHTGVKPFQCSKCKYGCTTKSALKQHIVNRHSIKHTNFTCAICGWISSNKLKILLHLIHHPDQKVDEKIVDTTILKKLEIMSPDN